MPLIDRGMAQEQHGLPRVALTMSVPTRNVVQPTIKESTMTVKPIPDGYHAVTPYLTVRGAAKVIEFVASAID